MAFQLQWGLDRTVDSSLSIARDIFLAANHDNVQPLAIAACQKFGNTIAMCQETCNKVETLASKTPQSIPIAFLQAYVGFNSADTASQLSKNHAGVQFSGLAAALVASLDTYEGGRCLHRMLTATAVDRTLLPTIRQLDDLLGSLQPRLTRSGFLDSVVGWRLFLKHDTGKSQVPDSLGIENLVNAFRQLSRIGEADITKVKIETICSASWVIAFTKWCLGLAPTIYLSDGTVIVQQPGSKVDVIIPIIPESTVAPSSVMKVSIHRVLGAPSELVRSVANTIWHGMVSVKAYGQCSLRELNFDTGKANLATMQAIPFALRHISESLSLLPPDQLGILKGNLNMLRLSAFPEDYIISQTASEYLGSMTGIVLQSLKGRRLEDLPVVDAHLRAIQASCPCSRCDPASGLDHFRECARSTFFDDLSMICSDILALSLYGQVTPLLYLQSYQRDFKDLKFRETVRDIISGSSNFAHCTPYDIMYYALTLTNHGSKLPEPHNWPRWMMSSTNGQVIYPLLFETTSIKKNGYLALTCLPGLIQYRGEVYKEATARLPELVELTAPRLQNLPTIQVTKPLTQDRDAKLVWITEQSHSVLHVAPAFQRPGDNVAPIRCSTTESIFDTLATVLIMEACAHDPNTALESPDDYCEYTHPTRPMSYTRTEDEIQNVGIVLTNNSEEMRFLSITNMSRRPSPVVLRKKACLSCCLDECRQAGYFVLVL